MQYITLNDGNKIRSLDKGHGMHNPDVPGVKEMLLALSICM